MKNGGIDQGSDHFLSGKKNAEEFVFLPLLPENFCFVQVIEAKKSAKVTCFFQIPSDGHLWQKRPALLPQKKLWQKCLIPYICCVGVAAAAKCGGLTTPPVSLGLEDPVLTWSVLYVRHGFVETVAAFFGMLPF